MTTFATMKRRTKKTKVRTMAKPRKQREAPPPSRWIRTKSGSPGRLIRTTQVDHHDAWLWRVDFGNVKGQTLWSIDDLRDNGVTFLDEPPADWKEA